MLTLDPAVCARALESRDPRFDGVFFVGIRTTMIYCRPICPSRLSRPDRRTFFATAAAAERHGYRPCLRCRPELAPGRAVVDAVPRVARAAAARIAAGGLNGATVGELAVELGIGERQLRRAMERELGVAPAELAQTQRLLLAKRLLTDTALSVSQVAFASGFQSLRRFHAVFQERYRMPPAALRRQRPRVTESSPGEPTDTVRLRLPFRPPFAWTELLEQLAVDACAGVETIGRTRYARTVALDGNAGAVFVRVAPESSYLIVDLTVSLLPVLMPLLARLHHLFDLDAEPDVIDTHLARAGLAHAVRRCAGLRVAGGFDGFEVALRELIRGSGASGKTPHLIAEMLGEGVETGDASLTHAFPDAARIACAGAAALVATGVPEARSRQLVAVARAVVRGSLRLAPGDEYDATVAALIGAAQLETGLAESIAARALHWPDAFPTGGASAAWRPWRSYAAAHLAREARVLARHRTSA